MTHVYGVTSTLIPSPPQLQESLFFPGGPGSHKTGGSQGSPTCGRGSLQVPAGARPPSRRMLGGSGTQHTQAKDGFPIYKHLS